MTADATVVERALIARGLVDCIILATDGESLLFEIENIGTDRVEEVLGDYFIPDDSGLYLFEGKATWQTYNSIDGPSDPELEWDGTIRPASFAEVYEMFKAEEKLRERLYARDLVMANLPNPEDNFTDPKEIVEKGELKKKFGDEREWEFC